MTYGCQKVPMINFLMVNWQPKHIMIGLFEIINSYGQSLAKNLTKLLEKYDFKKNMNGEKYNLNNIISILESIVSGNILGLEEIFQSTCFDYAFLKTYYYATTHEFFSKGLKYVFIKAA